MKFHSIKIVLLLISFTISYTSINAQSNDSASLLIYLRGMINENKEIQFSNVTQVDTMLTENLDTGEIEELIQMVDYSFKLSEKTLASHSIEGKDGVYDIPFSRLIYDDGGKKAGKTHPIISFKRDGSDWIIVNITDKDNVWKNVDGNWSITP